MDSLALPPVFFHPQNWRVIRFIVEHRTTIAVFGLRWIALSLFAAVAWGIFMKGWGHNRHD
jgi:hypothetical protein